MKWKPTADEKNWIRKSAADAARLLAGQITLDAILNGEAVPWAEFVRTGLDLNTAKAVTFEIYEMEGFASERTRGAKRATITVHIKNTHPPAVVYIS